MFSTILLLGEEGGVHIVVLVNVSKNADSHPHNHQAARGQDSAEAEKAAPMSPPPQTSSLNGAT